MTRESPLAGGRTTPGVIRIGDTVRRPASSNSGLVRTLLDHLAAHEFDGAPRFLGVDEQGRQCLSYIEGAVPSELELHDDDVIAAAARLIRAYHDVTADMAAGAEVICHNDLSPCNFVFVGDRPVALIDFDAAASGTRLWDLAYAAWLWLDIGDTELPVREQLRRLRLFVPAYDPGLSLEEVVEAMLARQRNLASEPGDAARSAWAADCLAWTAENLVVGRPDVGRRTAAEVPR